MFRKLLKHEFRATRGFLGIACAAAIGSGLLGGASLRYLTYAAETQPDANVSIVFFALALVAAFLALFTSCIAMLVMQVGRFYNSRFTDEGYLTFTLPVSGHQILLSSLVSGVVNVIIVWLVMVVSFFLLIYLGVSGTPGFAEEFWPELGEFFRRLGAEIRMHHVGMILETILVALVSAVAEGCVIMLSVTLGALKAKKHKILAAFGFYYLIHVVLSILSTVAMARFAFYQDFEFYLEMGITGLGALVIAAACYFPTHYLVTRRLNLP